MNNFESFTQGIEFFVQLYLDKRLPEEATRITANFSTKYRALIEQHAKEDNNDYLKVRRHAMAFKPALSAILPPGEIADVICDMVIERFDSILQNVKSQITGEIKVRAPGPVMPGSDPSTDLCFFCTICKEKFEIPADIKAQILNDSDDVELTTHHDKEMAIIIVKKELPPPVENEIPLEIDETMFSAQFLMGHLNSEEVRAEYLTVSSVGIDVGSSTTHLIFSDITLKRETSFYNLTNRFLPVNREVKYEGNIIFTPLKDRFTIDIEAVIDFIKEEYQKAGYQPEQIDTGAVIVTGEASKKQNASEITSRISSETGKFVSATAGPNFESLLGAMGSGSIKRSRDKQITIMNIDVGGGSSKLSISSNGHVLSTASISVGGRLLGIDKEFKIWQIDEPTEFLLQELNLTYSVGDVITQEDVDQIAQKYAQVLLEVIKGPATSELAKKLLITENLDYSTPIDEYSFSGGVSEMIYGGTNSYDDIGLQLANTIVQLMKDNSLSFVEPENKIRATVIGAGAFSLAVSGSTCYVDKNISLPMNNIPVLPVNVSLEDDHFDPKRMEAEIKRAYKNYDFEEGIDQVALYFTGLAYLLVLQTSRDAALTKFAKAIERALPNSIANKLPIILLFQTDLAKMLSISLRRDTSIRENLICLDELYLDTGDWVDIGAMLQDRDVYPVTVKSLVFKG
ncbi:MAG: ethanolamine ammonia-lyase reactivating factor EutA [Candidatus Hodarchaeales archaeon]